MADEILTAKGPKGDLFACVAPAKFTEPRVSDSRLGAVLRPFPTLAAADAAIRAAGGADVRVWGK